MQPAELDAVIHQLSLAGKDLEDSFRAWSYGKLGQDGVSNRFVKLGNEFMGLKSHLKHDKIDTSRLIDLPKVLRSILERALALPPSPKVSEEVVPQLHSALTQIFEQLRSVKHQLERVQQVQHAQKAPLPPTPGHGSQQSQRYQNVAHQTPSTAAKASLYPRTRHYDSAGSDGAHSSGYNQPGSVSTHSSGRTNMPPVNNMQSAAIPPAPPAPPALPVPPVPQNQSESAYDNPLTRLQRRGALERQASKRFSSRERSRTIISASPDILPTTDVNQRFSIPDFTDTSVVQQRVPDTPEQNSQRKSLNLSKTPNVRSSRGSFPASLQGDISATVPEPEDTELSVFLRVGTMIRKAKISKPPTIGAIRLQFVDVCDYNHVGGGVFPPITIQDMKTHVDYELTDATQNDVIDGTLLTLNTKTKEEITVETELKELKDAVKELASKMGGGSGTASQSLSSSSRNKFSSPILTGDGRFKIEKPEQSKESPASSPANSSAKSEELISQISHIKKMSATAISNFKKEIADLREKSALLASASTVKITSRDGMTDIINKFEADVRGMVQELEDIADLIDEQRVSIISHGIRFPSHILDAVRVRLVEVETTLQSLVKYEREENVIWSQIWETEVSNIVREQDWHKALVATLKDVEADLLQSRSTIELVYEANKMPRKQSKSKIITKMPLPPGEEKSAADAVLSEISELNLNSERRQQAVIKAERMHRIKAAMRMEEFECELRSFVGDKKLRPNGGMEAMEKKRAERDAQVRILALESEQAANRIDEKEFEEKKLERKRQREAKRAAVLVGKERSQETESSRADTESETDGKHNPEISTKSDKEPEKDSEPESQPEPQSEPQSDPEIEPVPKPEASLKPALDTVPEPKRVFDKVADNQAKSDSESQTDITEKQRFVTPPTALSNKNTIDQDDYIPQLKVIPSPDLSEHEKTASTHTRKLSREIRNSVPRIPVGHSPAHSRKSSETSSLHSRKTSEEINPYSTHYRKQSTEIDLDISENAYKKSNDPESDDLDTDRFKKRLSYRSTPVPLMQLPVKQDDEFLDM